LQTKLYTEDWIGLRTLDEAGRVKFVNVSGGHLGISHDDMKKHIVPYLKSQDPRMDSSKTSGKQGNQGETSKISNLQDPIMEGSSIYNWPLPVIDFFKEMMGITED